MASKAVEKPMTVKSLMQNVSVQKRFEEMLGKKAQGFITSVLQVVNQNHLLTKADPKTVLTAAATAATLDLPIDPNLGFAYIIPYNVNEKQPDGTWKKRVVAQFQMGYKGFIQLAQRSGQYQRINAVTVYENQFTSYNQLTEELVADFTIRGEGNVVGYAAHFELNNGFKKTTFWSYERTRAHGKRFSKSYDKKNSVWNDDDGGADAMGMKTVLKLILSKFGPLEIESQISRAVSADQSVQLNQGDYQYIDNPNGIDVDAIDMDKEYDRIADHIAGATSVEELEQVQEVIAEHGLEEAYADKYTELTAE